MKVENILSHNGNVAPNQFIIHLPENVTVFQSYNTVIAHNRNGVIVLDKNALDYSATTLKYLKRFLNTNESKKSLYEKIASGFYTTSDLN